MEKIWKERGKKKTISLEKIMEIKEKFSKIKYKRIETLKIVRFDFFFTFQNEKDNIEYILPL